ncbi:MAG: (d)CMP kinase [Bacteroidia bacterium]
MNKITIAIDGYSSCGKSTLARELALELGYTYIDTGAMYRAITLFFLRNKINIHDTDAVVAALSKISIEFRREEGSENQLICLNGKIVEDEIRQMEVTRNVSPVSALKPVRDAMVKQQQQMGAKKGIVMDGRDIGTVVFPDAELKLFMMADEEVRINRRYQELLDRGQKITEEEVQRNLLSRDYIDSHREESPLRQADDAVVINNTDLSREQQLELALALVKDRKEKKALTKS